MNEHATVTDEQLISLFEYLSVQDKLSDEDAKKCLADLTEGLNTTLTTWRDMEEVSDG